MKLMGAIVLLGCAVYAALLMRRREEVEVRLAEALLEDMAVLRREICAMRTPLPMVLRQLSRRDAASALYWRLFLSSLSSVSVELAWETSVATLSTELQPIMRPLGSFVSEGGWELGRIVDEIREELTEYLHTRRQQRAVRTRIQTALCLSGAGLIILVLI